MQLWENLQHARIPSQGFDLWVDSDDRAVFGQIDEEIRRLPCARALDIGFDTGVLAAKRYRDGCEAFGMDFSARMLELARAKMPGATLVQGDFTQGVPESLRTRAFDFIVSPYALYHLEDA